MKFAMIPITINTKDELRIHLKGTVLLVRRNPDKGGRQNKEKRSCLSIDVVVISLS